MWGVFERESVRAQVQAILDEIERLEGSEFPYAHSKEALDQLRDIFTGYSASLSRSPEELDQSVVDHACSQAFESASQSLEILGFILRSTNVRNAFEMYGPFLRLAQDILGRDTKLLTSSEWSFSPITYIGYEHLPGFVLIGLPSTESSNPLLLPLAGHELGHSVWHYFQLEPEIEYNVAHTVIEKINSRWHEYSRLFPGQTQQTLDAELRWTPHAWTPAWRWATKQCEELFCDFIGLRIFGEAYLWASAYLMAPCKQGKRLYTKYPNNVSRASALIRAAETYSLMPPTGYVRMFEDLREPQDDQEIQFLLSIADSAREEITDDLISKANTRVSDAGIPHRSLDRVNQCKHVFKLMAPAQHTDGLSNILNAAWEAAPEEDFFADQAYNGKNRVSNLKEIVLKSIEVYEIEQKKAEQPELEEGHDS